MKLGIDAARGDDSAIEVLDDGHAIIEFGVLWKPKAQRSNGCATSKAPPTGRTADQLPNPWTLIMTEGPAGARQVSYSPRSLHTRRVPSEESAPDDDMRGMTQGLRVLRVV